MIFFLVSWTSDWPLPWDGGRTVILNTEPENIVLLEGYCSGDSSPLAGGGSILFLKSPDCTDRWGNSTSSWGSIALLLSEDRQFFSGCRLRAEGYFIPGTEDKPLFSASRIRRLPHWKNQVFMLRARILDRADFFVFSPNHEAGGFLKALLLGVRDDLSNELFFHFRKAGVMHILALSGMHLGLLTGGLAFILIPLLGRRTAFPFLLFFLLFYLFLTGFRVSLLRAAIMFFFAGIAGWRGRECAPLRSLGFSLLICLILVPSGLETAGFQLSFAALGGIFLIGLPLGRVLSQRLPALIFYPLGVSLGAQAATVPVLLIHFGEWAPGGILCSLILTPLITIFLYLGVAGIPLIFFSQKFLSGIFPFSGELLYTLIRKSVELFSNLPVVKLSDEWGRKAGFMLLFLLMTGRIFGEFRRGCIEFELRFSQRAAGGSGRARALHDEEIRSELSDKSPGQGEDCRSFGSG